VNLDLKKCSILDKIELSSYSTSINPLSDAISWLISSSKDANIKGDIVVLV
jgi:hypothetical protein